MISQKVGLYPTRAQTAFYLFGLKGLPEPAKADKEKFWSALFFFTHYRKHTNEIWTTN